MKFAFALLAVALGCASAPNYRRALLTDQVRPLSPRRELNDKLLGDGWCWKESTKNRDTFAKCDGTRAMTLTAYFVFDQMVTAQLEVPLQRRYHDRGAGVPFGCSTVVPSGTFLVKDERAMVHEPCAQGERHVQGARADEAARRQLFSALSSELRRRYGPPAREYGHAARWRTPAGSVFLLVTRNRVFEAYSFALRGRHAAPTIVSK